jgi:hypothetical protein
MNQLEVLSVFSFKCFQYFLDYSHNIYLNKFYAKYLHSVIVTHFEIYLTYKHNTTSLNQYKPLITKTQRSIIVGI